MQPLPSHLLPRDSRGLCTKRGHVRARHRCPQLPLLSSPFTTPSLPLSPSPYPPPLSLSSSLGIWDNRRRATNQLNSLWLLRPEAFWRTQVSVLEMNMTKARELYDEARRAGFPQARNLWLRLQLLFADRSDSI